jgi:hypothetical protein
VEEDVPMTENEKVMVIVAADTAYENAAQIIEKLSRGNIPTAFWPLAIRQMKLDPHGVMKEAG